MEKKLLYPIILLTMILTSSCKDNNETPTTEENTEYFDKTYKPVVEGVPQYEVVIDRLLTGTQMANEVRDAAIAFTHAQDNPLVEAFSDAINLSNNDILYDIRKKLGRDDVQIAYRDLIIHYQTLDPNEKAILLSGRAIIGGYIVEGNFHSLTKEIMIATPATRTNNSVCASEAMPMEAILGPEALVVISDHIGYGITRNKPTPYIFNETAGRQSYDLALAAVDYMNTQGMNFSNDLKTYSCGLSQGGGYSLAVHKMMEGVFPKTGEALRFSGSLTSGGLYDLDLSIKIFAGKNRNKPFGEPSALPMIYLALKEYFPEETKTLSPEDVMNPALVKAGILEMITSKDYNSSAITTFMRTTLGITEDPTFDNLAATTFREDGEKEGNTAYSLTIQLGRRMSQVLTGWTPRSTILTIHSEQDTFVPYENCQALKETFGDKVQQLPSTTTSHEATGVLFFMQLANHSYRK